MKRVSTCRTTLLLLALLRGAYFVDGLSVARFHFGSSSGLTPVVKADRDDAFQYGRQSTFADSSDNVEAKRGMVDGAEALSPHEASSLEELEHHLEVSDHRKGEGFGNQPAEGRSSSCLNVNDVLSHQRVVAAGWKYHETNLSGTYEPYPLTNEMLQRSFDTAKTPQHEDTTRLWRAVARKMWTGKLVVILVLGTSETAGVDCDDGQYKLKDCAWPARVQKALNSRYRHANVRVVNAARGGTTTLGIIPALSGILRSVLSAFGQPPDMVVLDFAVADALEVSGDVGVDALTQVQAASEVLLNRLQATHSSTALVFFETLCNALLGDPSKKHLCFQASVTHTRVAHHYRVPAVSYRQAVWPIEDERFPRLFFDGYVHPSWSVHQLMADTFAFNWHRLLKNALLQCAPEPITPHPTPPRPLSPPHLLAKYDVCREPLTTYDPTGQSHLDTAGGVTLARGNWTLYADRPNKPGWISHGPANSELVFPLRLGADPRVVVSYLKSYGPRMGSVKIYFKEAPLLFTTVEGRWKQKVSMSVPLVISPAAPVYSMDRNNGDSGIGLAAGLPPHSLAHLVVQLAGCKGPTSCGKFKLVGVVSC